jgi:4-amino-4-deoxy-L-arabinose transferase-like glycosyltransferase
MNQELSSPLDRPKAPPQPKPQLQAQMRHWPSALVLVLIALSVWHAWVVTHVDAGLHVDEAQYWLWSKDLDWGYFSKPPMVAALIALSTDWLGDGLLGVRALAMLCYPLTAVVLHAWVREVVSDVAPGPQARPERAGQFAALVFIASPVAGLLGLVATTDAPLLLAWSLAARALWRAWRDGRRRDYLWLGLWLGLGLLSKYTMAAFVLSALGVLLLLPRRRAASAASRWAGLAWTALPALACLLPNLWWNAENGWPTLRHTAEITVGAAARNPLRSEGEYLAGLLLLLGPVVVPWALAWRSARGRAAPPSTPGARVGRPQARRFAGWLVLPLVALGALQALHAKAQVNWTAPALIGGVLALALWVHAEQPTARLPGCAAGTWRWPPRCCCWPGWCWAATWRTRCRNRCRASSTCGPACAAGTTSLPNCVRMPRRISATWNRPARRSRAACWAPTARSSPPVATPGVRCRPTGSPGATRAVPRPTTSSSPRRSCPAARPNRS